MRLGSTVIQGTRAAGGPPWCPFPGRHCGRVIALYHGANHHQTGVPSISTAKVPRAVGCVPAAASPPGETPLDPPPPNEFRMIKSAEETPHLEHVKDRRSPAGGDRLIAESLRRRDHPESQGPSGGVQGRLDGRAVAQAEGLISLPDPPD
jgi:hypothetical protein